MADRRVLVIGSQCKALGHLSFLPAVAEDIYRAMTDPDLGGCVDALSGGGLKLDLTVAQAKEAIEEAFRLAHENNDLLFLILIGHGEHSGPREGYAGQDFYFLPMNASVPPRSETAIYLSQFIKELQEVYSSIDGLIVLLDTCYAGIAAADAAHKWTSSLEGRLRYQVITAASDRPAYDACFSRTVTEVIRNGSQVARSDYLYFTAFQGLLAERCKHQQSQFVGSSRGRDDSTLWFAKNVARLPSSVTWIRSAAAAEIRRLTACFQPTPELDSIVAASENERCVAVIGDAGTGKSALAAALARAEVTEGHVREGFVQAIAFLSKSATSGELASQLEEQLQRGIGQAWAAAREQFLRHTVYEERQRLGPLEREVIGPLRWLEKDRPVRIAIDGLDRLSEVIGATRTVLPALNLLVTDAALPMIRLVVTSRPDTPLPVGAKLLPIGGTEDTYIGSYLQRRDIPVRHQATIITRARGNWLVARLLAELVTASPEADPLTLPHDLVESYDAVLEGLGASGPERWRKELRPILSILAAAGAGPVMPFKLLCAASGRLGGPDRSTPVHDILVDLRGYVARRAPGSDMEHIGLFHQTFAEYLLNPKGQFGIEAGEPHLAIADALAELAPIDKPSPTDPLQQYTARREAEHLWAIGKHSEAIQSLEKRTLPIPSENLQRWLSFEGRCHKLLGKDHPDTLRTRGSIASWTGETGKAREALSLFQELLPDRERVLGKDHPHTLTTRGDIATWTGETGKAREALSLFQELLPDRERVLGKDHPNTLTTRGDIARWTGETGNAREALRLTQELLPDQERVLGKDHPDTLSTRANIASWTGETGNARKALRLLQELLPDRERVLGKDHPDTLMTRANIAAWTGHARNARKALRLFQELLPDRERVLGKDHPRTLETRRRISHLQAGQR